MYDFVHLTVAELRHNWCMCVFGRSRQTDRSDGYAFHTFTVWATGVVYMMHISIPICDG